MQMRNEKEREREGWEKATAVVCEKKKVQMTNESEREREVAGLI